MFFNDEIFFELINRVDNVLLLKGGVDINKDLMIKRIISIVHVVLVENNIEEKSKMGFLNYFEDELNKISEKNDNPIIIRNKAISLFIKYMN